MKTNYSFICIELWKYIFFNFFRCFYFGIFVVSFANVFGNDCNNTIFQKIEWVILNNLWNIYLASFQNGTSSRLYIFFSSENFITKVKTVPLWECSLSFVCLCVTAGLLGNPLIGHVNLHLFSSSSKLRRKASLHKRIPFSITVSLVEFLFH